MNLTIKTPDALPVEGDEPATLGWMQDYMQLIVRGIAVKKALIDAGEMEGSCDCPKCNGRVRIAIVGRKAHLRMACACGLSVME